MKAFKSIFNLNQLDRYILFCQFRPFLFFSFVLVGILWLVQALPRLDDIISNGQSGDVFIKVAILMLPQVMLLVIPLAAFSATLYSVNQLFLEAEFTIFMSVGRSNISISKSIIVFGLLVSIFMYALSLYFVPISQQKLRALMFEVRQNLTGQLIKDGRFFHPTDGVSIYIRESNKTGEIKANVRNYLLSILPEKNKLEDHSGSMVIMIVGVNGTGKTTSSAKLANIYKESGKSKGVKQFQKKYGNLIRIDPDNSEKYRINWKKFKDEKFEKKIKFIYNKDFISSMH